MTAPDQIDRLNLAPRESYDTHPLTSDPERQGLPPLHVPASSSVPEDATVLQPLYPRHAVFKHRVFQHPDWRPFADQVLSNTRTLAKLPIEAQIQRLQPMVARAISAQSAATAVSHLAVNSKADALAAETKTVFTTVIRLIESQGSTMLGLQQQLQQLQQLALPPP